MSLVFCHKSVILSVLRLQNCMFKSAGVSHEVSTEGMRFSVPVFFSFRSSIGHYVAFFSVGTKSNGECLQPRFEKRNGSNSFRVLPIHKSYWSNNCFAALREGDSDAEYL
jgi:hypothetical protein